VIRARDKTGGDVDVRQECVSASIESGVDAAPVLDAREHFLETVALLVERALVAVLDFARAVGRDAGCDAAFGERFAEPARVVSSVCQHGLGGTQSRLLERRDQHFKLGDPLALALLRTAAAISIALRAAI